MGVLVHFPPHQIIMSTQIFQNSRNSFFSSPYTRTWTCKLVFFIFIPIPSKIIFLDKIQTCLKCSVMFPQVTFIRTWTTESHLLFNWASNQMQTLLLLISAFILKLALNYVWFLFPLSRARLQSFYSERLTSKNNSFPSQHLYSDLDNLRFSIFPYPS